MRHMQTDVEKSVAIQKRSDSAAEAKQPLLGSVDDETRRGGLGASAGRISKCESDMSQAEPGKLLCLYLQMKEMATMPADLSNS